MSAILKVSRIKNVMPSTLEREAPPKKCQPGPLIQLNSFQKFVSVPIALVRQSCFVLFLIGFVFMNPPFFAWVCVVEKLVTEQLFDGPTLRRVLEHAFWDKVSKGFSKFGEGHSWWIVCPDSVQDFSKFSAKEWRLAHCKLVSGATKRPYVYFFGVKFPLQYLRRQIGRRALLWLMLFKLLAKENTQA